MSNYSLARNYPVTPAVLALPLLRPFAARCLPLPELLTCRARGCYNYANKIAYNSMAGDTLMQPHEWMKLDNQLCFAFYTCSREIMKLYRPLLAEFGLTYTQYITLLSLWEQDNVTVKDLGAKLFLDSGTLTPLLKKLENMELITRTRDKADERNVIIALTERGRALQEQAAQVPLKLYEGTKVTKEEIMEMHNHINYFLRKIGSAE